MFTLSAILDCDPIAITDKNEIHLPSEILDIIGDNWVWEMWFDGQTFECTSIWKHSDGRNETLVLRLSDDAMKAVGWKPGQMVIWEAIPVDDDVTGDGPSTVVKVYSS